MIKGFIHPGSGLGDQLFSYIATRVRARELGVSFGFIGVEYFKGDFLKMDWGNPLAFKYHVDSSGKIIIDEPHELYELRTPYYDPEFNFVPDGTFIDGCYAQDERYFGKYLKEIDKWLGVEKLDLPDNLWVINFRGGEFMSNPDLFLTKDYWDKAIKLVEDMYLDRKSYPIFEVHTDDVVTAQHFFPDFKVVSGIEINWRSVRYAKNLILSNSAFGIIPALLGDNTVIAPKYWGRRNIKQWSMPQNYYRKFIYL